MARATSGNALIACAALLMVVGSACSSPPAAARASSATVCFGQMPPTWSDTLRHNSVRLGVGQSLGASAVDGDLAFGQLDDASGRGVGYVDLTSGRATRIFPYAAGVSGLGSLAVDRPWVVWEELDSVSDMSDWSIHAFNLLTSTHEVLAKNGHVPGAQPTPVVDHGIVAWARPQSDGTAQIQTVNLSTRQARTLATGKVGAPVFAGGLLLWSDVDSGLHAVDARTLLPAALPNTLRRAEGAGSIGGSANYLLWTSPDSSTLTAVHLPGGQTLTYTLSDRRHFFQFLQLAGDFVVWYSGSASSVLDLTTGGAFDTAGTASGSAQWIATASPPKPGVAGTVSRIPIGQATHVAGCAH